MFSDLIPPGIYTQNKLIKAKTKEPIQKSTSKDLHFFLDI